MQKCYWEAVGYGVLEWPEAFAALYSHTSRDE